MNKTLGTAAFTLLLAAALPVAASAQDAGQAQIEAALVPLVTFEGEEASRKRLDARRAELRVPAASVAVLRDGKLAWARAYGEAVDEATLFQFASLSKPVAAAGIIALAFERGVGLDDDISADLAALDLARLNPDGLPITLRGLLSHTNGATVGGFRGYDSDGPVPTTAQVIAGTGPANSDPVVIAPDPARAFRYSGGGYTVAQFWAEQVSGETFPDLMRRLVLEPLGMQRSTFRIGPPGGFVRGNVAIAHGGDGAPLAGGWHLHPESAAASLWSTPREYLLFVDALMKAARGEEGAAIAPAVAREMSTPVGEGYGLGIGVSEIDGTVRLSHSGSNVGYKSNFMSYPERGDAIVSVANSESGWPLVGDIGRTANVAYGWPTSPLIVRTRLSATAEELARFTGDYTRSGAGDVLFTLAADGPQMIGSAPSGYTFRLVKTGKATFIDPQDGQEGTFVTDDAGNVSVTFAGRTYVRVGE